MKRFAEILATFFYIGKIPFAPGTFGSLCGLLLCLSFYNNSIAYAFIFFIVLVLGFYSSGLVEKYRGAKDPKDIVIDEVAGIFIVYLFIPVSLGYIIFGFLLYRVFDIFKPFPIRWFERLSGGLGIMSDDIVCGVCTNLILQFFYRVLHISFA